MPVSLPGHLLSGASALCFGSVDSFRRFCAGTLSMSYSGTSCAAMQADRRQHRDGVALPAKRGMANSRMQAQSMRHIISACNKRAADDRPRQPCLLRNAPAEDQSSNLADRNSRFRRAMCAIEIDLGHSAWQAPVLVQLPKPSSSILATMALARRAPSTRP